MLVITREYKETRREIPIDSYPGAITILETREPVPFVNNAQTRQCTWNLCKTIFKNMIDL